MKPDLECITVSASDLDPKPNQHKYNENQIIKKERPNVLEIILLLTLKKASFFLQILLFENCAEHCLEPELEPIQWAHKV